MYVSVENLLFQECGRSFSCEVVGYLGFPGRSSGTVDYLDHGSQKGSYQVSCSYEDGGCFVVFYVAVLHAEHARHVVREDADVAIR